MFSTLVIGDGGFVGLAGTMSSCATAKHRVALTIFAGMRRVWQGTFRDDTDISVISLINVFQVEIAETERYIS